MLTCVGLGGVFAGTVYASTGCPEHGDSNADGVVDLFDLFCVLDGTEGEFGTCSLADVDLAPCGGDGFIGPADITVVENAFEGNFACAVDCLEPGYEPGVWFPPFVAPGERPRAGDRIPLAGVHGFNGEFYTQAVDLQIKGRGFNFVWARKYRSRLGPDTAQGNGWDFSYNIILEPDDQTASLHLSDGNSRRDVYELQDDETWTRREFFRGVGRAGAFAAIGLVTVVLVLRNSAAAAGACVTNTTCGGCELHDECDLADDATGQPANR